MLYVRRFFSLDLGWKSLCTVCVALLPFFLLVLFLSAEKYRHEKTREERTQAWLMHEAAHMQAQLTSHVKTSLEISALAIETAVQQGSSPTVFSGSFKVLEELPWYFSDLILVDDKGTVRADYKPGNPRTRVQDMSFFTLARIRNSFAVGELVGEEPTNRLLYFGYKSTSPRGTGYVIAAGLSPDIYQPLLNWFHLCEGICLYIVDASGKIIYSREGTMPTGDLLPQEMLQKLVAQPTRSGVFYQPLSAGYVNMIAYERLAHSRNLRPYAYVILSSRVLTGLGTIWTARNIAASQIGLCVCFLVAATVLLVTNRIITPLIRLKQRLEAVTNGKYQPLPAGPFAILELTEMDHCITELATNLETQKKSLKQAETKGKEANKLKSRFLARMSHELRKPVNTIIGMSYLTLKKTLTKQQQQYLSLIHYSGQQLLRSVTDILELSRLDTGHITIESAQFSIRDVFAETERRVELQARAKDITLVMAVSPSVPQLLQGDSLRIGQVIGNLVDNAIRYSTRGIIEISCDLTSFHAHEASLLLSIKDYGKGIEKEKLLTIQRMFAGAHLRGHMPQAPSSRSLGLLLACRVAALMGGYLTVTSHPGVGSTFQFHLTLHSEPTRTNEPERPYSALRVLVIGSDLIDPTLVPLLQTCGMRVDATTNIKAIQQILTTADKENDAYQLVCLDWRRTEQDGMELCASIKNSLLLREHPLIIMISPLATSKTETERMAAGIDAYLGLPADPSLFFDTVANLLQAQKGNMGFLSHTGALHPKTSFPGLNILVVDDNAINRQIAEELLTSMTVTTRFATNGLEALAMLRVRLTEKPFDLVLMDLEMPVMNGFDALKAIRNLPIPWAEDLPVIAMTAHNRHSSLGSIDDAGFNDYVPKPIVMENLQSALRRWKPPTSIDDPHVAAILTELLDFVRHDKYLASLALFEKIMGLLEPYLGQGRLTQLKTLLSSGNSARAEAWLVRLNNSIHYM